MSWCMVACCVYLPSPELKQAPRWPSSGSICIWSSQCLLKSRDLINSMVLITDLPTFDTKFLLLSWFRIKNVYRITTKIVDEMLRHFVILCVFLHTSPNAQRLWFCSWFVSIKSQAHNPSLISVIPTINMAWSVVKREKQTTAIRFYKTHGRRCEKNQQPVAQYGCVIKCWHTIYIILI